MGLYEAWSCLVNNHYWHCSAREQKSQVILNLISPNKTPTWPWLWSFWAAAARAKSGLLQGHVWVGERSGNLSPCLGKTQDFIAAPNQAESAAFPLLIDKTAQDTYSTINRRHPPLQAELQLCPCIVWRGRAGRGQSQDTESVKS